MNFRKLVEQVLVLEAGPVDSTNTNSAPADLDKVVAKSLVEFLKKNNTVISTAWKRYDPSLYPFPSISEIEKLAYTVNISVLGRTKDSSRYQNLQTVYPLLDLLANLAESYRKGTTDKEDKANEHLEKFVQNLKNSSPVPFEYSPDNPWASMVKEDFYGKSQTDIGSIRIDELPGNLSIYGTIKRLLNLRLQFKKISIPLEKIPSPEKYIEDIFTNPQFYIQGKEPLPSDKKMELLYDATSSSLLLNVSKAAYLLFKQQAEAYVKKDKTGKFLFNNEQAAYLQYLGFHTDEALTFAWEDIQKNTNNTARVESFNANIKNLFLQLNEDEEQLQFQLDDERKKEDDDERKKEDLKIKKPFQKTPNGPFLYSLNNVKLNQQEVPPAKYLYEQLTLLANYTQKEVESDLWGATKELGSALGRLAALSPGSTN